VKQVSEMEEKPFTSSLNPCCRDLYSLPWRFLHGSFGKVQSHEKESFMTKKTDVSNVVKLTLEKVSSKGSRCRETR
jgi:hypothetical protein